MFQKYKGYVLSNCPLNGNARAYRHQIDNKCVPCSGRDSIVDCYSFNRVFYDHSFFYFSHFLYFIYPLAPLCD